MAYLVPHVGGTLATCGTPPQFYNYCGRGLHCMLETSNQYGVTYMCLVYIYRFCNVTDFDNPGVLRRGKIRYNQLAYFRPRPSRVWRGRRGAMVSVEIMLCVS